MVVGASAGSNITGADEVICIGAGVAGQNVDNSCYIGNIFGATIDPATATLVGVDVNNKLGTIASSKRFKKDIKPMDKASEAILALKPVTFHYKSESKAMPQFGLIAEEVAEVNPNLVVHDKNGEILTVRYDQVNAMLLNEFLKEHKKVEEQQATITQLKTEMQTVQTVIAQLKDQAAQIQKVNAHIETSRPAPQLARNRD